MWQRFTERARRIVFNAQGEAARWGTHYVGTEHLLLGLIREMDSVGGKVLTALGLDAEQIRSETEPKMTPGQGPLDQEMQLTPRAKRVIDLAYEEARLRDVNYIGTEHLIVGLVREGDGLAARTLRTLGLDLDRVRAGVDQIQEETRREAPSSSMGEVQPARTPNAPLKGDLGRLQTESAHGQVEVAVDPGAVAELSEVLESRDHHGYRELLSGGRIWLARGGTEVKLLRKGEASAFYVRILSGEREGQAGWVLSQAFQHTGPDTRPFPPPIDEGAQGASEAS